MCKRVCAQKIAKASVTSCFFLRASLFSYCHIFASSHLNLITSSHLQMFTPFISSHHTSSHLPIFTYPPISFYVCLIHLHLLSFRHLHIFPSQLHISLYSSSLSGHPSSSYCYYFYYVNFWIYFYIISIFIFICISILISISISVLFLCIWWLVETSCA